MTAIATILLSASSSLGATQSAELSINQITASVPHSLSAEPGVHGADVQLFSGSIGPVSSESYQPIHVEVDFSFESYSIAGDFLLAWFYFVPQFSTGTLELTDARLTADLYDGPTLVSRVDSDNWAQPLPVDFPSGQQGELFLHPGTFDPMFRAFPFLGDNGGGTLEFDIEWSGFSPGDSLSIEVVQAEEYGSSLQYWYFIPGPWPIAVLAGSAFVAVRRGRRLQAASAASFL